MAALVAVRGAGFFSFIALLFQGSAMGGGTDWGHNGTTALVPSSFLLLLVRHLLLLAMHFLLLVRGITLVLRCRNVEHFMPCPLQARRWATPGHCGMTILLGERWDVSKLFFFCFFCSSLSWLDSLFGYSHASAKTFKVERNLCI